MSALWQDRSKDKTWEANNEGRTHQMDSVSSRFDLTIEGRKSFHSVSSPHHALLPLPDSLSLSLLARLSIPLIHTICEFQV